MTLNVSDEWEAVQVQSKIDELLVDWEIARQEGRPITPEELCRECPELLPELVAQIEQLAKTSWLFEDYGDNDDADPFVRQREIDLSASELVELIHQNKILTDEATARLDRDFNQLVSSADGWNIQAALSAGRSR